MRSAFLYFLLLSAHFIYSQHSHTKQIDSLNKKLSADSAHIFRFQKFRLIAGIDNRNSFIRKQPVNLYGLQIATIYKEKHTIGLGGYKLTAEAKTKAKSKISENHSTILTNLDLRYMTVFYQPAIIDKRFFELDLPVEIGLGKFTISRQDSASGIYLKPVEGPVIPIGAGVMGIIKPFKWIGVSGLIGYRYAREKNINFNGMYYSIGVWADLRQIIRDIRFYLIKKPHYRREIKKLNV